LVDPAWLTEANIDADRGCLEDQSQVPQDVHSVTGRELVPADDLEREMAALYASHASSLLRYAFSLIKDACGAQDALQEIFLRYFIARREGRSFNDPKAWLFRVMRNYSLDILKSSSVKNEVASDGIQETLDSHNDPEKHYHRTEMARDLARLLSSREMECVRLRAEGLSYDEIAQILNLRQGTVGATLARAHKKIRQALGYAEESKEQLLPTPCATVQEENSYSS
jgi:RNA polymerase sigma-70 factor (ECF subfamily)